MAAVKTQVTQIPGTSRCLLCLTLGVQTTEAQEEFRVQLKQSWEKSSQGGLGEF